MNITPGRKLYLIFQHRLQSRIFRIFLPAQAFTRPGMSKPCKRTDHSRLRLLEHLILFSGIQTDLIYFFFPWLFLLIHAVQKILDLQPSAGNFDVSQPGSLAIPGNFIYLRPEIPRVLFFFRIGRYSIQQRFHSIDLKR